MFSEFSIDRIDHETSDTAVGQFAQSIIEPLESRTLLSAVTGAFTGVINGRVLSSKLAAKAPIDLNIVSVQGKNVLGTGDLGALGDFGFAGTVSGSTFKATLQGDLLRGSLKGTFNSTTHVIQGSFIRTLGSRRISTNFRVGAVDKPGFGFTNNIGNINFNLLAPFIGGGGINTGTGAGNTGNNGGSGSGIFGNGGSIFGSTTGSVFGTSAAGSIGSNPVSPFGFASSPFATGPSISINSLNTGVDVNRFNSNGVDINNTSTGGLDINRPNNLFANGGSQIATGSVDLLQMGGNFGAGVFFF